MILYHINICEIFFFLKSSWRIGQIIFFFFLSFVFKIALLKNVAWAVFLVLFFPALFLLFVLSCSGLFIYLFIVCLFVLVHFLDAGLFSNKGVVLDGREGMETLKGVGGKKTIISIL